LAVREVLHGIAPSRPAGRVEFVTAMCSKTG